MATGLELTVRTGVAAESHVFVCKLNSRIKTDKTNNYKYPSLRTRSIDGTSTCTCRRSEGRDACDHTSSTFAANSGIRCFCL